ncbi:RagB/SusD family nutrient uptake outer membrane protein [Thermophagus sp. OGC60D27]|uniref:RagB/SusD family nutrient uptake outer membrane protein n=1 Tax=Thermophagus sp. OGC60D27 TaxID=3458415 RepID=UPI004037AD75
MKNKVLLLTIIYMGLFFACNEEKFLQESPLDFLSGENAYKTEEDFDAAIVDFYRLTRLEFFGRDENRPMDYLYGTDIVFDGEPGVQRHTNMTAAYDPTGSIARSHWDFFYTLIAQCNTTINRLSDSSLDADQQKEVEAIARFFRGLSYRTLAYLYGGVPIVIDEVKSPKTDYVRETKENTLKQAIDDVLFAAENLPDITEVRDGEVSSPAAYHLLSELYISAGLYTEAIDAASEVIDNPALELMQTRFGSRATETPGDVYWDLFRMNNQNRSAGNTEAIWVIQYETDLPGGASSSASLKNGGNFLMERHHGPFVRDLKIDGENPFSWPIGDYTGGRGIGWAISTQYFSNTIWESDFDNDIRNANHNFVREFVATNPNSSYYGQVISTEDPALADKVPSRQFYAYQTKCTTPFNHPDNLYSNKETLALKSSAGATYTDQYMFRLAETYLLRAEAYFMDGNPDKAAADINVVRARANANPVAAEEVSLGYILDERMREFGVEEKRRITLMRTGTLYERVKKCNPYYTNPETNGDGVGMLEKYNLWPIPQSAIEANTDAVLQQNPGYN